MLFIINYAFNANLCDIFLRKVGIFGYLYLKKKQMRGFKNILRMN